MAQRRCEHCQNNLNKGKRFCSKECYRLFCVGKVVVSGNKFKKGQIPWNKGHGIKKECLECGSDFKVVPSRKDTAFYCSKECAGKQRKNLAKYQKEYWKDKIENGYECVTPENKLERKRFREEIQKKALERDNYTCQMCDKRGCHLHVDHIQSWSEYVELRFDINNCRTLCVDCHYLVTFGKEKPKNSAWGENTIYIDMEV